MSEAKPTRPRRGGRPSTASQTPKQRRPDVSVAEQELESLVRREHGNPHSVLGAHPQNGGVAIRALRPSASSITATLDDGSAVELEPIHPGGIFQGIVEGAELPLHYRLEVDYGPSGTFTIDDPRRCTTASARTCASTKA
jgi:1,4-alpha-glucan branching enzyme